MEMSDKKIWKKWWIGAIFILLIITAPFIKTNTENNNSNQINNNEIKSVSSSVNEEIKENKYVEDDLVNKFIEDFKSTSNYELTDIKNGNIRTKYYAYIDGQYCEFLNATENLANYFKITIYGGNQKEDINKIINVYKEVIKTLDPTIPETSINDTVMEHIQNQSSSYNLSDSIYVTVYPIIELSYGKSNCRIEISTTLYN